MIKIENLYKSYGDIEVLKGVNLHINKGETYGIVGSSGAGKSTLLRCINGLEKYDKGSLKVDGIEIKDLNDNELQNVRRNIGMIFQQFAIMKRKTVFENIALPMECWKYDKKTINNRVKELLEIVKIPEKICEKPNNLSGGQLQRVAIARSLALGSKILLCDEATSALDPLTTDSILNLLKDINNELGITIVIVTHQMEVIRQTCNKMSVLDCGEIVASGEVDDIFINSSSKLISLLGQMNKDFLPKEGANIRIIYSNSNDKTTGKNILSKMAKELDLDFSLVSGDIQKFRAGMLGTVTINIDEKEKLKTFNYLDTYNICWKEIGHG